MAKPNYSFEKRQRELAKKKKKEEKLREKAERKANPGQGPSADGEESGGTGNEPAVRSGSDGSSPAA